MGGSFIISALVLLAASVLAVPLAKRLGLGSIIGYLAAGIIVGPMGLRLVSDVGSIRQLSELGVVMLLFLVGLEVKPARLWVMRRAVFAMGSLQVLATGAAFTGAAVLLGLTPALAAVAGFGLALSSTALVLPMLSERDLLKGAAGRDTLGILLFQDLAIIPMVALLPLLAGRTAVDMSGGGWQAALQAILALAAIFIGGRFLIRPLFRAVLAAKTREILSAAALLIVLGTAMLAASVGLSMSLGAFLAGVLLSESEYRHELQADIEPFEGLLLGLFFVSVGMAMDVQLLAQEPLQILGLTAVVMLGKMLLIFVIAKLFRHDNRSAVRLAVALAQIGEFGLVLFSLSAGAGLLPDASAKLLSVIVVLSLLATPLLFALQERLLAYFTTAAEKPPYDVMHDDRSSVIICGFGRVGQVIGRILRTRGISFTALDADPDQVEVIRRFGNKVFYGDPSRQDVLRAAGAQHARMLVVVLDDPDQTLKIIDNARHHFPHLVIFARARNRRHAHLIMDRGVNHIVRETFYSALRMSEQLLCEMGLPPDEAYHTIKTFREHDERTLRGQHAIYRNEKELIQSTRQAAEELRSLFQADRPSE